MFIPAPYLPAAFSLAAVAAWGSSDFLGGLGARRVNAFLFTLAVHASSLLLAGFVAWASELPFPGMHAVRWALAAGAFGGFALALFYRALAGGKMGLVAPVAAVLSAAVPTVATAFAAGFPGWRRLAGFALAGLGVWLISRTESAPSEDSARPKGLGMAALAGCGFAGFYLCIHQAGNGSALWIAVCSRCGSLAVTLALVSAARLFRAVPRPVFAIAVIAGLLDTTGSVVFVRAEQIGRLDVAVVLSSLYPAVTVILARVFLREHFSRARSLGMLAALAAVPMIAG